MYLYVDMADECSAGRGQRARSPAAGGAWEASVMGPQNRSQVICKNSTWF